MKLNFETRVAAAASSITGALEGRHDLAGAWGLVTGTGLGALADDLSGRVTIPYADIADFPTSTAPSHESALHIGQMGGQTVMLLSGRFHLYEGWSADDVVLPIYVMRALGADRLLLTNAAGTLNPEFQRGEIAVITDHMNFQGVHALTGPNPDALGVRFPDLSTAYDKALRGAAKSAAQTVGLTLREGIYAAVAGPELETNAERRFLRMAGADLVGMSTVMEVIAANHAGLRTLAFSAITNKALGDPDQQPDLIEHVIAHAEAAAPKLRALITAILSESQL